MDAYRILQELISERRRVQTLIEALESLRDGSGPPAKKKPKSTRGRKHMDPAERASVSERMRRYWAEKRQRDGDGNS